MWEEIAFGHTDGHRLTNYYIDDRLYRVKSRLETGKKLDKEAIEELLAAHGDTTTANHLNPNYVGAMLRGQIPGKESQDLKVYKKNQQFQNDGVAGFMIYKFRIKNEGITVRLRIFNSPS